jgi:hypothetical protein
MSEGELRKRLLELIPIDTGGQIVLDRIRFLQILDEAKKEIFDCLTPLSEKDPEAYGILYEDKLIELLIKWFGYIEKKSEIFSFFVEDLERKV